MPSINKPGKPSQDKRDIENGLNTSSYNDSTKNNINEDSDNTEREDSKKDSSQKSSKSTSWKKNKEGNIDKALESKIEEATQNLREYSTRGNAQAIKQLLEKSSVKEVLIEIVNCQDESGKSILHEAVVNNHLSVVKILIEDLKADINIEDNEKKTPLHIACKTKRFVETQENPLEYGRSPGSPSTNEKQTLLAKEDFKSVVVDTLNSFERERSVLDENSISKLNLGLKGKLIFDPLIKYLIENGANFAALDEDECMPIHLAIKFENEAALSQLVIAKGVSDMMINPKMRIKDKIKFCGLRSTKRRKINTSETENPLLMAVKYGNEQIVKILIHADADVFAKDNEDMTPLHHAAVLNYKQIAEIILHSCDTEMQKSLCGAFNRMDKTPLHLAIIRAHLDMVTLLLNFTNIELLDGENNSYLHAAALSNSKEICDLIGQKYFRIAKNPRNLNGEEPLHLAASHNASKSAKYFLKAGSADINTRDNNNLTPAMVAAKNNAWDAMEILLQRGADMNLVDHDGKCAIYHAVEHQCLDIIKRILNSFMYLKKVKESRNWFMIPDKHKNTPLHCAAMLGYESICRELLRENANAFQQNNERELPIDLALRYGRSSVVKFLMEERPKLLKQADHHGNTIVHRVARWGHTELINYLLKKKKLKIGCLNSYEQAPIYFAAAYGHLETLGLLIENGAEVNIDFKHQMGPIHAACQNGHHLVVQELLDCDADPRKIVLFKGNEIRGGVNALDISITNGHKSCAMVLLNSLYWKDLLSNKTQSIDGNFDTPLRKAIRFMPDLAFEILNKFISYNDLRADDPDFIVKYDFSFLDDTYVVWKDQDKNELSKEVYNSDGYLKANAISYNNNRFTSIKNHPFNIMAFHKREELFSHELVRALLFRKWRYMGNFAYIIIMMIHILYLILLCAYMFTVYSPYGVIFKISDIEGFKDSDNLTSLSEDYLTDEFLTQYSRIISDNKINNNNAQPIKSVLVILVMLCFTKELFQLAMSRWNYLNMENAVEVILYVLTVPPLVLSSDHGLLTHWQWQVGVLAVLMAWANMLISMRKVPQFGIYVIMLLKVMKTFLHFSFIYILLSFAFATSMSLIFSNKTGFNSIWEGSFRISAMTIGELDLVDLFYSGEAITQYQLLSKLLFVFFILTMCVIVMNLMVGLAVDDIKFVQNQSTLQKRMLMVELALRVEASLPMFLVRKIICRDLVIKPNFRQKRLVDRLFTQFSRDKVDDCEKRSIETLVDELQMKIDQNSKILTQILAFMNKEKKEK